MAARFMGYRWNVTRVGDANDLELLTRAFQEFQEEKDRPTLIIVDSHIGYGSPHKQDTAEAHGEPLGEEEVRETKRAYGWPEDAEFLVPDGVYEHFARGVGERGRRLRTEWEQRLSDGDPQVATEIDQMQRRALPDGWDADLPSFEPDEKGLATRKASHQVLNVIAAAGAVAHESAPPTSPAPPGAASTSTARARRRSSRRIARVATSIWGSASTGRPRSRTGSP